MKVFYSEGHKFIDLLCHVLKCNFSFIHYIFECHFLEKTMYSKAYYKALEDGEARNTRIPIIIVGSDRVGKSSLRKHFLDLPFHIEEPSTNGIEVDVVELTTENAKGP